MQKTKIGISVGLLAAVIYFMGLFGGYMVTLFVVGYVLLCEENEWLKKSAVKAVVLMMLFSLVIAVINLVPNAMSFLNYVVSAFGGSFYISFISNMVSALTTALGILEKIVFVGFGVMALGEKTIAIPGLDGMIDKHMVKDAA